MIHCVLLAACVLPAAGADAQEPAKPEPVHEHVSVPGTMLTPTRETTGTSWMPQDTPMFGVHRPWGGWDIRLDGTAFGFVVIEPGDRHRTGGAGEVEFALPNWGMMAARRGAGPGRFGVRVMVSAEPLTVARCGSLSYIATGEVCDGDIIHDRQQPHDALMELAVDYERPLRGRWRWQVYAGLAGEPALGPPRASHRSSSVVNPIGPVTHHWLESTSTAFGVVTAGVHNGRWKAEASMFNGRDPDERRGDLDLGGLDSFAGRVSFVPTDSLALQLSAGRVRSAMLAFMQPSDSFAIEATASMVYHRSLSSGALWATTAAIGANRRSLHVVDAPDATTFAGLLESSLSMSGRHTFFGRLELLQMPASHLHALEQFATTFGLTKVQAGYVRELRARRDRPGDRGDGGPQPVAAGARVRILDSHRSDFRRLPVVTAASAQDVGRGTAWVRCHTSGSFAPRTRTRAGSTIQSRCPVHSADRTGRTRVINSSACRRLGSVGRNTTMPT